ncbi:Acylamino-acid-releasing enzyme [Holothuria leucospilota]|uniref:Acylamino-acid-releasing enzyme n=1 Tax=Holothuria leucospilota TaxID=206669 RepID=A0A9Q1CLS8_HOLLE|nr:Acylamino-acid-releasing enzyme [Holothuria leucospilota]
MFLFFIVYDWTTKTTSVVVDVVGRPDTADSFPGLFVENLPVRCWATDNKTVYISTTWRSTQRIVAVNVTSKSVTEISLVESYATWAVEDVKDNFMLARRSSPVKSGQLVCRCSAISCFSSNVF